MRFFFDWLDNRLGYRSVLQGLRDRPLADRQGWRALFDYYIFGDNAVPRAHLPENLQGALGDMNEENARRIRDVVAHSLKR